MTGDSRRRLPAAAVVVAVAAMAIAARRDGPLDGGVGDGLWQGARPAVALAAVVVLVVVATNFTKHRDDGYGLLHRAGTATAVLLTAAAVLTPIGLLYFGREPQPTPRSQLAPDQSAGTRHRHFGPSMGDPGPNGAGKSYSHWIALGILYLILAVALGLVVYVLVRLLSLPFKRQPLELLDFDPLAQELDELAEAVAAGTEALEYEGDAREAVIACYSAMELAVSAGGGGRRATDTPEEFLSRVTAARLIPEEPARRLTELFREARFSGHRIAEAQRDAARESLQAISEHLRVRAEAQAAAVAQARAGAGAATGTTTGAGTGATTGAGTGTSEPTGGRR